MRRDEIGLLQALREQFPSLSTDELTAQVVCRRVWVDDQVVTDPKQVIARSAKLVIDQSRPYVSRGGYKLEGALQAFGLDVKGLVLLDAGSSTGGFTDCLLAHGARLVHAVDVGYNQLDWKLRSDERVVVHERTNIMGVEELSPTPDAATCDLSFRSISGAASHILSLCKEGAFLIALIKPQFEVPKYTEGFDGVVRDPQLLKEVLLAVLKALIDEGVGIKDLMQSPITGTKGNTEFFALLHTGDGLSAQQALSRITL
ncbi:MAG: TlyA family RNA methyltransferase [Sphaerochaeta sp.]|jgi:23S rRNA (cytidine1920-2'-O)/16S rRNA (cytidine1409-2'-O)-methyltransferase